MENLLMSQSIREVLILHHSHTDIGYTHSQPVAWRLHNRFIDQAIDLCEETAGSPEDSRARWTCEITAPVLNWLKSASPRQKERFRDLAAGGQLAIGGMLYNICPLMDADQLLQSLQPVRRLREELNAPIRVAINHDVNGLPWPLVGFLKDAGIDLLIMGLNIQFGASPFARPRPFRWIGPDGRSILVWHGEHYDGVGRIFQPAQDSTKVMAEGWKTYEQRLLAGGYPFDFAILTATRTDWCDNNPPSPQLARMIRRWNDEGREPRLRFVTPEDILAKLQTLDAGEIPELSGDWTDYWNFGCASTAIETRIHRQSKVRLRAAELLHSACGGGPADFAETTSLAWESVNFFGEHTWGHHASIYDPARDDVRDGAAHKDIHAYEGRSLSLWALREQFEAAAGNPPYGTGVNGLLVCNPTSEARIEHLRIPAILQREDRPNTANHVHAIDEATAVALRHPEEQFVLGPVALQPYECRFLPKSEWKPAPSEPAGCASGANWISSPHHRLEFSSATGRVTRLLDLHTNVELLDSGEWDFFGLVRETVDVSRQPGEKAALGGRDVIFKIDYVDIFEGRSGWNREWPAIRETPGDPDTCEIIPRSDGLMLRRTWEIAPGVRQLVQEILLSSERPEIHCNVSFWKDEVRSAESLYFTFPLALADWRAHFDTGDFPTEYEAGQLPGTLQDYLTVGSWACVHNASAAVTMACPDAPMIQIGGFRFGRFAPADRANPCLLLAWALNNYWDTNFRTSQPGFHHYHYRLRSEKTYDPVQSTLFAEVSRTPLLVHPVIGEAPVLRPGRMLDLDNPALRFLSIRESSRHPGHWVVRIMNITSQEQTAALQFPAWSELEAARCDTLENPGEPLPAKEGRVLLNAGAGETLGLLLRPLQ